MKEQRLNCVSGLSSGHKGAISELIVSADLLKRGWEVFRSVAQTGSFDLVAHCNGSLIRIEVRTGIRYKSGILNWNRKNFRADHYAVVVGDKVEYHPELPSILEQHLKGEKQ